jgi:hypothetical protein
VALPERFRLAGGRVAGRHQPLTSTSGSM